MAEFNDLYDKATTAVSDFAKGFTDKSLLNLSNELYQNAGIGNARRFSADKFKSTTYQYPSDLFSNTGQYGDNYVAFYINVPTESKLAKNVGVDLAGLDTASLRGAIASKGYNVVSALAPTVAGAALGGALTELPKTGLAFGATTGSALAAVTQGSSPDSASLKSMRQMKRLSETIVMNVPNNLSVRYSMNYADEDQFASTAAANATQDMTKMATENGGNARSAGGQAAGTTAGLINAAAGVGLAANSFSSAATGLAANPKKEQIFKNVDFRTFSFEYTFAPRNAKEADQVKKIIKAFKVHMHPEYKDTNAYLLIYPSEFDIVYYQGNEENLNLPRHTSCVLTEMSINYTPNNQFSTFTDGTPNIVNMTLVFKELAILTKDQIMDGF